MNNSNNTCVIHGIDFGNLSLWQANRVIRGAGGGIFVAGFNLPQLHQICEHYQFRNGLPSSSSQCVQLGQILDGTDGFYKFQLQERPWHNDTEPKKV